MGVASKSETNGQRPPFPLPSLHFSLPFPPFLSLPSLSFPCYSSLIQLRGSAVSSAAGPGATQPPNGFMQYWTPAIFSANLCIFPGQGDHSKRILLIILLSQLLLAECYLLFLICFSLPCTYGGIHTHDPLATPATTSLQPVPLSTYTAVHNFLLLLSEYVHHITPRIYLTYNGFK